MANNRLQNEIDFHNKRYASTSERSEGDLFYLALNAIYQDYKRIINKYDKKNNKILEVGCGKISYANIIKKASYYGIDCSKIAIDSVKKEYKKKNIKFEVRDAHNTHYPDRYFDFIFGMGILHHLDINKALNEIKRISKSNNILFVEPIQSNFIVRLYRFCTPGSRSPDERPLDIEQINLIVENFEGINVRYYGLTTLFLIIIRIKSLYPFFFRLDNYLSKFKIFRNLFWAVLITN